MDAQDSGRALLRRDIESAFTHTDNQVNGLRALHEEMFRSISIRFDEKERRLVEAAMAGKTLVEVAFASSKEAVAQQNNTIGLMMQKSEGAFTKQIDSLFNQIATTTNALNEKIEEGKRQMSIVQGQITLMQGQGVGKEAEWTKSRASTTAIVTAIGVGVAFLGFLVVIFNLVTGKGI